MPVPAGMHTKAVDRRTLLKAAAALAGGAMARAAAAQDEVSEAALEAASGARPVRIGHLSAGTVETLPLEVYVARVLAGEADPRAPEASREALAIAIRTYTLVNESRHGRDGFDLCDTTHCQVLRASSAVTRRLTLATAGQVLTWQGRPAPLYYSASCGGYSERASDVWPGVSHPYLQARPDDVHDDEVPWTLALSLQEVEAALLRLGFTGQLRGLEIERRTESGRVGTLRVLGMAPERVGGDQLRLAVSATRIRSTAFTMMSDGEGLHLVGRGYGHGVGMCVVGAARRAARGESARQILAQYYPGLELTQIGPPAAAVPPRPRPFPLAP